MTITLEESLYARDWSILLTANKSYYTHKLGYLHKRSIKKILEKGQDWYKNHKVLHKMRHFLLNKKKIQFKIQFSAFETHKEAFSKL